MLLYKASEARTALSSPKRQGLVLTDTVSVNHESWIWFCGTRSANAKLCSLCAAFSSAVKVRETPLQIPS